MKEYEAIIRIRVRQPDKFETVTPTDYVTVHIADPDLGVMVVDVKIVESEGN